MRKNMYYLAICLMLGTSTSFAQQWAGSTTTVDAIYRDGNVGIGTTIPLAKLHVNGSYYLNRPSSMVDPFSTLGISNGSYLGIAPTDLSATNDSYMVLSFPTNNSFRIGTNYDGHIGTPLYRNIEFGRYTGDPYLIIKDGGNVGIGTTTPQAKIDVNGLYYLNRPSQLVDQLSTLGIPNGSYLGIAPTNLSAGNNSYMLFSFPTNNSFRIGTNYDGHLTNGYYRDIEFGRYIGDPYLIIKDGGNVGIGTTSPGSFKLAVEGKIGAREVHVTSQNPWPDYVFSNQYKLKSLSTLEDYIKKNNRLPDMPSAEEIKSDGLELGQMNTRVVEKIEELTLYIIELNKKIAKLEKDNAYLRKQINK